MAQRRTLVRAAIFLLVILALVMGGVGGYLAWSIPRDIRAEGLLKEARQALGEEKRDEARKRFSEIVRDYPRTDAAAAATFALFEMADQDRLLFEEQVRRQLEQLAKARQLDQQALRSIEQLSRETAEKQKAAVKASTPQPAPRPATKAPAKRTTPTQKRR